MSAAFIGQKHVHGATIPESIEKKVALRATKIGNISCGGVLLKAIFRKRARV